MSKFQIVLLVIFGVFIVGAVMLFSFYRSTSSRATVLVWGDIPQYNFFEILTASGLNNSDEFAVQYEEKQGSLDAALTEALSEGRGPDLVILPMGEMWQARNKLTPIPYDSVSERDFKATFIEEAELLMGPQGYYALPFSIDPLVLYYNRDLLSNAGMAKPFSFWDEIYVASTQLTKKDPAGNLTQSVMALGEAKNIPNYKEVISLLMLQAGTPVTYQSEGKLTPLLTEKFNLPLVPAEAALDFYTQFSNPAKVFYSWNRSQKSADTHFASGDSVYYLGFASDLKLLKAKNPTLNFSVAPVPQSRVSGRTLTYGRMQGIAIVRSARNVNAAFALAKGLVSRDAVVATSNALQLPPIRRDLLAVRPSNEVLSVFYDAAIQARGWLDPDSTGSSSIFKEMIESVTSGRARISDAVGKAQSELEKLSK